VRGSLVALQQLAITFGIMVSFWIDYGTNFIGGTGEGQSQAAWRIPLALQLVPAIILGVGILFMPFSPRWLVNNERDDEALAVLSRARNQPVDSDAVQIEFLCVVIIFKPNWTALTIYLGRSRPNTSSRRKLQL
jgi:MFS family permease